MRDKKITYKEAINEAIYQEMERDKNVFIYGIGVPDCKKIFGTTERLQETFGKDRCFDTPLSEDSLTGFALGAAINGLRPILVHMRVDFSLLAMNQLINQISSFRYMSDGKLKIPIVIRNIIGRGWGQGCQHTKTMQSIFAHIPGLKVVMPTTVRDVKGMMIAAIRDDNPVMIMEHRWLYFQEGEVEEKSFRVPLDKASKIRDGEDVTIIATSWMNVEALRAAQVLEKYGISVEIIDARCISSVDLKPMVESVSKTRKCIIADYDWVHCGFGAELAATIYSSCFRLLDCPIERMGFAHTPCPTARHLENEFYPDSVDIIRTVEKMFGLSSINVEGEEFYNYENKFKGPF
ncbi:MAG: alpha-ketoacid dehydrogenase subunit beta [Candidatus Asgardarchaeia archaeon]